MAAAHLPLFFTIKLNKFLAAPYTLERRGF
jgi:hypothetical protein